MPVFRISINEEKQSVDSRLYNLGENYLLNFLSYQQRDFQQDAANQRHQARGQHIKLCIEKGLSTENDPIFAKLVEMQNKKNPSATYEQMKDIIIERSTIILEQLDSLNRTNGENYKIEDCTNKVFEQISKEDFVENFIEEQKNIGENEISPNLMNENAFKNFNKAVEEKYEKILRGERVPSIKSNSDRKKGFFKTRTRDEKGEELLHG